MTCATDVPPTFQEDLGTIFNETKLLKQCERALSLFSPLPGSSRFVGPLPDGALLGPSSSSVRTLIIISSYAPDSFRPNLQFWINVPEFNAANELIVTARYVSSTGSSETLTLLQLGASEVPTNVSCPASNGWVQVVVSVEPVVQLIASGDVDITKNINFDIVGEQEFYFDNLEFVGPPLINDTYDDRFVRLNETEVVLSFSNFGSDIVGAIFFILPPLYFVLCLFMLAPCCDNQSLLSSILSWSWLVVSTGVVAYAIVEYQTFLEDTAELNSAAQVLIDEYLIAREQLNPREFNIKLEGGIPFGFTSVAIPRFNQSVLEKLFVFSNGPIPADVQSLICPSSGTVQCVENPEEFFNRTEAQDADVGVLKVESQTTLTQDYFLPILLGSLISDVAISAVQVLIHLVACVSTSSEGGQVTVKYLYRGVFFANVVSIFVGLAFSATIVGFVIIEPIRYDSQVSLKEQGNGIVLPVEPKPELLTVLGNGDFFLESSSLGLQTRCPLNGQLESVGLEPQTLAQAEQFDEVFPNNRVGTVEQTCDANTLTLDFVESCYTLDCSKGRIPLVSSKSVEPRINFLYDRIIYNLVVIDVVVTLVDVFVFLIHLRNKEIKTSMNVAINEKKGSVQSSI